MGRTPCCSKDGMNKGAWTAEEDQVLRDYITTHGEGKWRNLPKQAGLKRCGKSCRLRWLNYLRPDIKRGNITEEEEDLIIRLHKLLGNRWALIAGRIPGRTDNEVKNYWNTTLRKKVKGLNNPIQKSKDCISNTIDELSPLIKPQLAKSTANIQTSESGQPGFELQDLAMNPLMDSFDVDEFLHSDVSDSDHDLWKLCSTDRDHRHEFEFDETLIMANDFQNVESDDHGLPSSSCQPVFFSEEMLMEHWSDHVRDG